MNDLSTYLTEKLQDTYYNVDEIPTDAMEEIIKEIEKRGFGAAGPAITSDNMYRWIAREWAGRNGERWSRLAYLRYTAKSRNTVDEILHKYFNMHSDGGEDYWYKKSTPLKSVLKWLGDDFVGTMENPA